MRLPVKIFLLSAFVLAIGCAQASPSIPDIDSRIRIQVEAIDEAAIPQPGQPLHAAELVSRFYQQRSFSPAWLATHGLPPRTEELLLTLQNAGADGMNPEDYHLSLVRSLLAGLGPDMLRNTSDAAALARLDILCTDAFLTYAAHLIYGRFNPGELYRQWQMPGDHINPISLLNQALESGQIAAALETLLPEHTAYHRLRQKLARYRDIAAGGGWSVIDSRHRLQAGDRGQEILLLRDRLFITGELPEFNGSDLFDEQLTLAVIDFQASHGLATDGIVGHRTLAALNVPVEERIHQITLNMERWRWLPQRLGERYIHVNINDFSLSLIEQGETAVSMPVIVGMKSRSTPSFSADMTYIEVNPYWHVPKTIAVEDKLPLIRADPGYLPENGFRVYRWSDGKAVELDPESINWSGVEAENWNYSLRQDPGENNALGSLKFMLPNKFSIYLHDTPARQLFERKVRTFSSGCIRLASPIELANHLLGRDPDWDPQTMTETIASGKNKIIALPEPISVYVLYWTAWVGGDGRIQFRDDIYGHDAVLAAADSVSNITDLIAFSSSHQPLN